MGHRKQHWPRCMLWTCTLECFWIQNPKLSPSHMCEWSEKQKPQYKRHFLKSSQVSFHFLLWDYIPTLKNKLPLSKRSINGKRISMFCTQPNLTIPYLFQKIRNAHLTAKMTELEPHCHEIFSNL